MAARFKVDLREIEGEGEFLCPSCGQLISPDDESGITYSIIEIGEKEDGEVREVTIQCMKCRSAISLVGFEALEETKNLDYLDEYLGFRVDIENIR